MMQDVHVQWNISIVVVKVVFNKKNKIFTRKLDLNLSMKQVKCYSWCIAFVRWWNLDTAERISEIPGKFWNVALKMVEKISRQDHVKNGVLHRVNEARNILHTYNKKKDWLDWSHLAQGRPSKTRYSTNDNNKGKSDGNTRKET